MHLPLIAEFLTATVCLFIGYLFIKWLSFGALFRELGPFDVRFIRFLDIPCGNGPVCRIYWHLAVEV